jgi:hypothetical protein
MLDAFFPRLVEHLIQRLHANTFMDQDITLPAQARLFPRGPYHPLAIKVLQEHIIACLHPQLSLYGVRQFNPSGVVERCLH